MNVLKNVTKFSKYKRNRNDDYNIYNKRNVNKRCSLL